MCYKDIEASNQILFCRRIAISLRNVPQYSKINLIADYYALQQLKTSKRPYVLLAFASAKVDSNSTIKSSEIIKAFKCKWAE
jgi:hypothetical protein